MHDARAVPSTRDSHPVRACTSHSRPSPHHAATVHPSFRPDPVVCRLRPLALSVSCRRGPSASHHLSPNTCTDSILSTNTLPGMRQPPGLTSRIVHWACTSPLQLGMDRGVPRPRKRRDAPTILDVLTLGVRSPCGTPCRGAGCATTPDARDVPPGPWRLREPCAFCARRDQLPSSCQRLCSGRLCQSVRHSSLPPARAIGPWHRHQSRVHCR
jgi:hypothetical protein